MSTDGRGGSVRRSRRRPAAGASGGSGGSGGSASRRTSQQEAILAVIASAGRPLSPAEILELASQRVASLGQATVYRAIARMIEHGELVAVNLPGQPPRYETTRAAREHHHHFQCDECGRVFDLLGCPGDLDRLAPPGFQVRGHELTLHGQCGDCGGDCGGGRSPGRGEARRSRSGR